MTLSAEYWDKRYNEKNTGWDIGHASPPLTDYFDQLSNKEISILIPGCGNAYEAEYLLKEGFTDITLLDVSPVLIQRLREKFAPYYKKQLKLVQEDFFGHDGQYELIVEQTFFCALKPEMRPAYAEKMHSLLKPDGKLMGVLFQIPLYDDHPPYGGTKEEYLRYFEPWFKIEKMETAYNSIEPRQENELFILMKRKL